MPRESQHDEATPRVAETRARPRLPVHSLAYIELSDENAGLILNISETGISVQAVQALSSNHFPRMRFRLPGTEISVEVEGRIVWQIRPKKEAGIEFVDPSGEVRTQIRNWIAAEPSRAAAAMARARGDTEPAEETARPDQSADAIPGDSHKARPVAPPSAPPASTLLTQRGYGPGLDDRGPVSTGDWQTAASPLHRKLTPPDADRDWRSPGPPSFESDPKLSERPRPDRIPAMPQWNGYVASRAGMEFRRPRRWWTYAAALGFIGALGFAALMILNPDAITRARIEALTHQPSTAQKDAQPASPEHATNASPSASRSAGSNSVGSSRGEPSVHQPQLPNATGLGSPLNPAGAGVAQSQHDRSGAQPNTSQGMRQNSPARSSTVAPYNQSVADSPPTKSANQYAYRPGSQTRNSSIPQVTATPQPRYSQPGNSPSNSPAGISIANSTSQLQTPADLYTSPAQRSATPSAGSPNTIEAGRAQSTPPLALNSPANSSSTSNNQQSVQQRDQDAYARSSNSLPPTSSTTRRSITQSQVSSVEVPGSASSPVPPSVPLVGVPSGLVGASSQFHAIRVPPELQSKSSQLAGNLQIGQLISSYSPAYPIGAAREGIEGTVKLNVIVGRDGRVRSVQMLSGPPILASSAASAVRDWHYGETFLVGQAIETEQYVTLVFRLAK
jgi:TonB family protein